MKQGGLVWNCTLNEAMLSWGFKCLKSQHCIYFWKSVTGILVAVHVDNFFTIGSSKGVLTDFKVELHTKWEVFELGEACFCLGTSIKGDHTTCTIC
jgi:hypothetical protein